MKLELEMYVWHKDLYRGKERMTVCGIRRHEIELEGDWSGGTHDVNQKGWLPIEGILLERDSRPYHEII